MLSDCRVAASIPCKDLAATRMFYEDKLGLKVSADMDSDGGVLYECADGTFIGLFLSMGESDGSFTQAMWEVADIDGEMADLRSRGVEFEKFDMPGFTTDDNGVVDMDGQRVCWFKDPAGNLLALGTGVSS